MKNINGEIICGDIWTKDYQVNDSGGSGLKQRTEVYYCTKKPGHSGAHCATYEGGPKTEEVKGEPYHGKLIKCWTTN